jgi:glycosyltransferase involved in cell wall biosynthesis
VIVGVSMVRDEADIIGITIDNLIRQGVDRFLVLDNGSIDDTRAILERFPQVSVTDDPERGYYQSRKMSALAEDARCIGATWVVPFDADEMWIAPPGRGRVAEVLEQTPASVVWANTFEHPPITPPLSPYRALHRKRHRKVAFRPKAGVTVAQGNHDVSVKGPRAEGLEIREFQYRTFEQFKRKVRNGKAAYDATDLPAGEGAHWREFGAMTDCELVDAWESMVSRNDTVYDPAPIRC